MLQSLRAKITEKITEQFKERPPRIEPLAPTPVSGPAFETGLNCLIRLARQQGLHFTLDQLKRDYPLPESGRHIWGLGEVAKAAGLKAEVVDATFDDLMKLGPALPALLEVKQGRYVLITGINNQSDPQIVQIEDPMAENPTPLPVDKFALSRIWSGRVLLAKRSFEIKDKDQPFGLRWIVGQLMREKRLFVDVGVAAVAMTFLALAPVVFFLVVLSKVFPHNSIATLNVLVVGVLLAILIDTAMGYLRRYVTQFATRRIDARLNMFIYDRVLNVPIDYFERTPTGVTAGNMFEIWRIRNFLTGPLFSTGVDLVSLVVLIPIMFLMSWQLSLFVLGLTAIMAAIVVVYLPQVRDQYRRVVQAEQAQNSYLIETLQGMRTVKSLALTPSKRRDWDVLVAAAARERYDLGTITNRPATLSQPLDALTQAGTIALGAYIILAGGSTMDIGMLMAFNILSRRVIAPLVQSIQMINQVEELRGAIAMVGSVVNQEPEEGRSGNGVRTRIMGSLSFEKVRFSYKAATSPALDDVSFTVPQGSILGVMGRSGSGKTTVTRLLQVLHSNYSGLIKIDGIDIRQFDIDHLRRNVGVVLQENFLFRGTIRENICGARIDASFEEVVRAAQLAGAEEFIERLPRGYETMIEEGAANLSGGQRQRLAIARALILEPPILVLDEATSALDAESEAIINANLLQIARGRTLVVISHKLSALIPAHQILVMERGKVHDAGTHNELLQRCDIYRSLWNQQNGHILRTLRVGGAGVTPLRT